MGLEDKLHQKMVSIVLGGVAKIDQAPKKTLFSGVRDTLRMRWQRIRAFFRSWIDELKRDIKKNKKTDADR